MTLIWQQERSEGWSLNWTAIFSYIVALAASLGIWRFVWLTVHGWRPWAPVFDAVEWFWNCGPVDDPWIGPARWMIVTGIAMALLFAIFYFVDWYRLDRK